MIKPQKISDIYNQLPSREELIGFPTKQLSRNERCYVMPCHITEDDYYVDNQLSYGILVTGSDLDQHRRKILITDIPLYFSIKVPNGIEIAQFRKELREFLATAKECGWTRNDVTAKKLTTVMHRDTLGWDPCEYSWIQISFDRLTARREAIKLIESCLYTGNANIPFAERLKNTVDSIIEQQRKKSDVYGDRFSNVDVNILHDEYVQFRRIVNITKTPKILSIVIKYATDSKRQRIYGAFNEAHAKLRKEYRDRIDEICETINFRRRRGEDHTLLETEEKNLRQINQLKLKEIFEMLLTCNVCSAGIASKHGTCLCVGCSECQGKFHVCRSRVDYGYEKKPVPEELISNDCTMARDYVNRLWNLIDENTANEIVRNYYNSTRENIRFCPTADRGNLVTGHDECNDYFKTVMSEFKVSFSNWICIDNYKKISMDRYTRYANCAKKKTWPKCTALLQERALIDDAKKPLYASKKKIPCPGCDECIGGCVMLCTRFNPEGFNNNPVDDKNINRLFSSENKNPVVPNLPFMSLYWDIETVSNKPVSDVPLPKNKDDEIFMIGISIAWAGQRDSIKRIALATVPAMDCSTAFHYRPRQGHGTPSYAEDPDRNFQYIYCTSEKVMLLAFAQLIRLVQPDIMSGFNDQEYDFPWVVGRTLSHGILPYFTAAVSQRVLTQHDYMYKCKSINKKSFSDMIDDERYGIPPKVGEIIQQIRQGNHNDYMLNTAIRLIKTCYKRTDVKMEAGSNHKGESLAVEGMLVVDSRLEMRRKHPKAISSSLNSFLQMLKLVTKEDMPYHVMFAVYKRARIVKKDLFEAIIADEKTINANNTNDIIFDDSKKSALFSAKHTESMILRRIEENPDLRTLAWDMHRVAAYCTVDAQRCHDLLFKGKILINAIELASRCGVTLEQCFYKAGAMKVRNYCNSFAFSKLYNMCPTSRTAPNSMGDSKFPGAYVCDPKSGLYTTKLTFEERIDRACEKSNINDSMDSNSLRVPKAGFSEGLYNNCQWRGNELDILKRFVVEFGYDEAALNSARERAAKWRKCDVENYDPSWSVPSNWHMPVKKTKRHVFNDFIIGRPDDADYVRYDPNDKDYVIIEDYWPTGWYQQRDKSGHLPKDSLPEDECIFQDTVYNAKKIASLTKDGDIYPQRSKKPRQYRFRRLTFKELEWCLADDGLKTFLTEHMQLVLFALDFKSLYPSLMRAFNLSVDRIVELHKNEHLKTANALGKSIHEIKFPFQERVMKAYSVRHDDCIDESNAIYSDDNPTVFNSKAQQLLANDKDNALNPQWFSNCKPTHGGEGRIRQLGFDNGLFPHLEAIMFDTRNAIKKGPLAAAKKAFKALMEELKSIKDEKSKRRQEILKALEQAEYDIAYNDAKQGAVKIVMNTLYGESGNRNSPLFMLPVSGGITTAGKHCTLLAKKYIETVEFHKPGYGDTDSLYIEPNLRLFENILRLYYAGIIDRRECSFRIVMTTMYWSKKLSQRVNDILYDDNSTNFMIMAYEEVLHPTMLISKKRYLGVAHEDYFTGLTEAYNWTLEHGKPTTSAHIFLRGVDVVRRGTTQFVFKTFYAVVMYLLSAECTLSPQEAIIRVLAAVYKIDWSATPEDMASSKRYKEVRNVKNYISISSKAVSDEDYIIRLFRHLSSLKGIAVMRVYNRRLWDTYRDYSRNEFLQLPSRSGILNANKIIFKVIRGEKDVTDYELHRSPNAAEGFKFKSIHGEWEPLLVKKERAGNVAMLEFVDRLRQRGTIVENMQRVATVRVKREKRFTITGKCIEETAGSQMEPLTNDAGENLIQKYNLQIDVGHYIESLQGTFSKMLVNWKRFYRAPKIKNPCTTYCILESDYNTEEHRQRCAGRTEPTSEEIRETNEIIADDIEKYLVEIGQDPTESSTVSGIMNDRQYVWKRIEYMLRNYYAHNRCKGTPCTYEQIAQPIWFNRTDDFRSPTQNRSEWKTTELKEVSYYREGKIALYSGWSFHRDNIAYAELPMVYLSADIEHVREYHKLILLCSINGRKREAILNKAGAIASRRFKKATKIVWDTYESVNEILEPYSDIDYDLESLNLRELIATTVLDRVDKIFENEMPRDDYVDNLILLELDRLMTRIDEYRDVADMCRIMITAAEKTLYETGIINHWFCRNQAPPLPPRFKQLFKSVHKSGLDIDISKQIQKSYGKAKLYCKSVAKIYGITLDI